MPKLAFRYGLDLPARCGLPIWSLGWLVILIYMLATGEVNSEQRGGAVTYSRAEDPLTYWVIAGVTAAMCVLGLALTFELSFDEDDRQSTKPGGG